MLLREVHGAEVMPAGQPDELALLSSKLGERQSSEDKNTTYTALMLQQDSFLNTFALPNGT